MPKNVNNMIATAKVATAVDLGMHLVEEEVDLEVGVWILVIYLIDFLAVDLVGEEALVPNKVRILLYNS